jgi:hypothetical protein
MNSFIIPDEPAGFGLGWLTGKLRNSLNADNR